MSVSRRGFLQGLKAGRSSHAAEFMAARGHEEHLAYLQQGRQGGMNRPQLPPGVQAIRIPFNRTPLDADLEMLVAKIYNAKRENVVLGVGSQELLKNAARVFLS